MNRPQIHNMVKARAADGRYVRVEGVILLSKIIHRHGIDIVGLVSAPKSSIGNIERYLLLCHSLLIRRNSCRSGFNFSVVINIQDWTGARHDFILYSAVVVLLDPKDRRR